MTIKELKDILNSFPDDTKDVIIWNENTHTVDDIESISDNNGHMQLNVEQYNERTLFWLLKASISELEEHYGL